MSKYTRRNIVKGGAFLGATSITACSKSSQLKPQEKNGAARNFVLVHGAWHGGWCWRDVKNALIAKSHNVLTPTMTGLGERSHLMSQTISLETHIQDIISAIKFSDMTKITLVGHSYGGMIVTAVADRLGKDIDHVVYLDAAVPKSGQSMLSQGEIKLPETLEDMRTNLLALSSDDKTFNVLPPELFGIPVEHEKYSWVKSKLRPHPMKTWFDTIKLSGEGLNDLRKTYIHCTKPVLTNSSFPYHAKAAQQDPDWIYINLATGHDAMITAATEISEILSSLT